MPKSAPVDQDEFNIVPACLISEEFLGIVTYLRFQDGKGRDLLVIRSGQSRASPLRVGEHYDLAWPIDVTTLMPAEPQAA